MSTTYAAPNDAYRGTNCIDSDLSTLCATTQVPGANWIAVRVPSGTRVGPVAVYNRRDNLASWLGAIDVRLAPTAGDATGLLCGSQIGSNTTTEPSPYVMDCGGATSGEWVVLMCNGQMLLLLSTVR